MDRSLAVAGLVVLVAVGFGIVTWPSSPQAAPVQVVSGNQTRTITVHVSGAVARPGLVILEGDPRVADAVAAAGGAITGGDLSALNLAATVADGSRIVVPLVGEGESGAAGDGLIRLNTATAAELQGLPGVGPVLADRIVSHREANGPFGAVEDLLEVPGIGEAKLGAIRDVVIVP